MTNDGAHAKTRRMMATAIRRLNALEYVILGGAMALALLAGALTGAMVESLTGSYFRVTWIVTSLLFFIVPGALALKREREAQREADRSDAHQTLTVKGNDGRR
jgi:uncharacterized membrane protein